MEVDLHEAARWHDGRPVTAQDVAYTFNHLYRINPGFPAWQYLSSVDVLDAAAERPRTVAFRFRAKDPNPLMVQHWLTLNAILPQHIWEPLLAAAPEAHNPWRAWHRWCAPLSVHLSHRLPRADRAA
jgi:microcin C transport system substrate-binding protein